MRYKKYDKRVLAAACGLLIMLALVAGGSVLAGSPPANLPLTPQPVNLPSGLAPGDFPVPTATVDGWVNNNDQVSIRAHAWALWSGMTSITSASQGWPVFETWYTDGEVQAGKPSATAAAQSKFAAARAIGRPTHNFEQFRQFHHAQAGLRGAKSVLPGAAAAPGGLQVLGFNKFDADYANFVWSNNYNTATGLWNVQNSWPVGTPPAQRIIQPFVNTAVGLKPVFQAVAGPTNGGGVTVLPYWLGDLTTGPSNSSNPANPTFGFWNQCVVVYTTPSQPSAPISNWKCGNSATPSGFVSVNQFYNFALTAAEAVDICGGASPCPTKAGDFAILVAMHMTTKEDENWTWQTFWWNYGQPFPYGGPPPNIPAPFNNYAMCTAYSMTTNPVNSLQGQNGLCYNPYLETGLTGVAGINSDCMSCHATAGYGNNPNNSASSVANSVGLTPNYPSFLNMSHYIAVANQADAYFYYACNTSTDFSWFLGGNVSTAKGAPATNAPCATPAGSPPTGSTGATTAAHKPAAKAPAKKP
jgi:hypothetical protein